MKTTKITFAQVFNTGNYENQRIEVEIELQEGDSAKEALTAAKKFVWSHRPGSKPSNNNLDDISALFGEPDFPND